MTLSPDHAKNADFMRAMVRVQNAIGLLCPVLWQRDLQPQHRQIILRERTRGLVLHDLAIRGEAMRLKIRLDGMKIAAMANTSQLPQTTIRPHVPAPLSQK